MIAMFKKINKNRHLLQKFGFVIMNVDKEYLIFDSVRDNIVSEGNSNFREITFSEINEPLLYDRLSDAFVGGRIWIAIIFSIC